MSKRLWWAIVSCAFALAVLVFRATQVHKELAPLQASPDIPQVTFSNYVNVRFAYSVCYPSKLFVPQGESGDGDGQKFVTSDMQAMAVVYGSNNALRQPLQQVLDQDSDGVTVIAKSIDTGMFTFSGRSNDKTISEKTLLQNQQFKTLNIQFPTRMATTYAPIAERMIGCFSNTTPTQYSH
jgi:hypothetical protein